MRSWIPALASVAARVMILMELYREKDLLLNAPALLKTPEFQVFTVNEFVLGAKRYRRDQHVIERIV